MWVMYDSTTPEQIPASATAVAGYVGGRWPTYATLLDRWPHAHHLSIAINAQENADCLDIESGDAQPRDAPLWVRRQQRRGIHRPALYCDLSTLPILLTALKAAKIARDEVRIWTANPTGTPHITPGADATQWTWHAKGLNLDETLAEDTFFPPTTKPKPAPKPAPITITDTELQALKIATRTLTDVLARV